MPPLLLYGTRKPKVANGRQEDEEEEEKVEEYYN
jgi:hypothetical protein